MVDEVRLSKKGVVKMSKCQDYAQLGPWMSGIRRMVDEVRLSKKGVLKIFKC
jgi:hypothetical protein